MAKVPVNCPKCAAGYQVEEALLGKKGRCKKCDTSFVLARTEPAAPRDKPGEGDRKLAEDGVPPVWRPGDVILDLYEVKPLSDRKPHAEGGMGRVNRVRHRQWNIDLAVKSPLPGLFTNPQSMENFEREAETWVNLGLHPHTVSCFYVRRLGGIPRVFAEFVAGGSLHDWIYNRKLYEGGPERALERILDIAIQFAWGLHHAHESGLIHQDVKPANVMVTPDGTAKVTDFGLAKARAVAGEKATAKGQSILVSSGGMTPAYCSPEQANGEPLTRKTDIWSWAVSVVEMFAGEVTWPSGTVAGEALEAYRETGTGDASMPLMPGGLVELMRRCFRHRPEARPRDMREIAAALQEVYKQTNRQPYARETPQSVELLADSQNNWALSLLDLNKPAEAETKWQKALEIHPHHPEATYNFGLFCWRAGRMTDVALLQELCEVAGSRPRDWSVVYLLAQVHAERRDWESAKVVLQELGPDDAARPAVKALLTEAQERFPGSRGLLRTFEGHKQPVHSVCLSGDGRLALSGGEEDTLRLWEVATGRCLRSFDGPMGGVSTVCLSGEYPVALLSGRAGSTLQLWEISKGRCLNALQGHTSVVTSACLSVDGRFALSGSYDKTLRLWEVATGRCLRTFKGHSGHVSSVSLSADGRLALSGSWDNTLRLWEVATGRCLRTFEGHTHYVWAVCLSADGQLALSGSWDSTLRLWEVATGRCLRTFVGHRAKGDEGHSGEVYSVCFSGDGRLALSASADSTLRLWEVATGRCLRTFEGHTDGVTSVCLSGDGRLALSGGSDRTLRLWEIPANWKQAAPWVLNRLVTSRIAQQTSVRFRDALRQGRVCLRRRDFRAAARELRTARMQQGYERHPEALTSWAELYLHLGHETLRAGWEAQTFEGHESLVNNVCLSADGCRALSRSNDQTLRLWDVATGRCLRVFEGHKVWGHCVCLSGDARLALSGSYNRVLYLWEVTTGQCICRFKGHREVASSVFLSADGRYALSGSLDQTVRLWEVATGRCLRTFEGHTGGVSSVCLSGDGRHALSAGDWTLRLWEVATGQCLGSFEGHTAGVNAVCLSGHAPLALSGSDDNTMRLWEVATGRCLRTFEGHTAGVSSVCLSGDGRFALSGSWDETLRMWEVATGRCLRTFEGHTGSVTSVCLSGDGRFALSGSADKTLKLWFLDWELDDSEPADWGEGAGPYLEVFLSAHTPWASTLPSWTFLGPNQIEITRSLTREGKPSWTDKDFQQLLYTLGCAGYGWLRPEGVRSELEKMAATWQGPPPLP